MRALVCRGPFAPAILVPSLLGIAPLQPGVITNPPWVRWAAIAVAGAAVVTWSIIFWNLRLRQLVRARTRQLEDKNRALLAEREKHQETIARCERLGQILEATTDFVATCDVRGQIQWLNPAGLGLVGLRAEQLGTAKYSEVMAPWAVETLQREGFPAAIARGVWSGQTALISPTQGEVPISQVIIAHRTAPADGSAPVGEVQFISTIGRDISVLKQTEQRLTESRQRLQLINAIAMQVNAGMEPDQVVRHVVEHMAAFFPHYRVRFCTLTSGGVLNVDHSVEPAVAAPGSAPLPAMHGMAADLAAAPEYLAAVRGPGAVPVSDTRADPRLAPLATFLDAAGIRATISHGGELHGVLAFDAPAPHEWTEHEVATISEICDYLALAIAGARSVQQRLHDEERLRHSEERLRLVIENMPAMAFAINSLGRIVFWNQEAHHVTGYSAEEIVGDPFGLEKLLPDPEYRKAVMSVWSSAVAPVRDLEFSVKGKDGSDHTLSWSSISHRFPIAGWQTWGIATDVTMRRRAEEGLRLSEERYRLLFESSPQAMWVYDNASLRFLAVNEAGIREYGYSREEFLEMTIADIRPPEDVPRLMEAIRLSHADLIAASGPWRHRKKNGQIIEVEVSSHSVPFIATHARLVIVTDVTERNRSIVALKESRARLEQAQAVAHVGSWVSEPAPDGKLFWSRETCRIFGLPDDQDNFETTVPDFFARVHHADRDMVQTAAQTAIDTGGIYSVDHRIVRSDGTVKWVHEQAEIERDEQGRPLQLVGVVQDITDRKLAEAEMAQRAQELARSNAELERFAYVASHDLQEPLRMVTSFTQLLAQRYKDKLDKDAHEFIGFAVEGATRMQRLIEDLLAYSRVGSANRRPGRIQSLAAMRRATANLRTAIQDSGAEITAGDLPEVVADESQLSMVFQNLIGNAIKFRGGAAPKIEVHANHKNGSWLFEVKDNGIGIDAKHRERIFTMFHRLNPRSVYPGNGIGLAICKRILEGHGGRIWVESTPGAGSTFYFTLPEEPPQ
jgi:PAS domain S-box-containing protein